jgi:hypothetical protein
MREDIIVIDESLGSVPESLNSGCVLAANGLFLLRRLRLGELPFIQAVQKVGPGYDAPGMLPFIAQELALAVPKIGRQQFLQVEAFFRKVYTQFHGEAIVFLYFTPSNGGKWQFTAIEQKVNQAHLDWVSPGPAPRGWYLAGSFHSHHTMSAFHSGTDDNDELGWDGVHVTVGKILSPHPEYAASVVIGGQRFKVSIDDFMEPTEAVTFPEGWMNLVSRYVPPQPKGKVVRGGKAD